MLKIVCWTARALSVFVFLFWGGFFVEHTQEWFIDPLPQVPPLKVWFAQPLHFLIRAGLAIGWRWERLGGILVVVAGVLFLVDKVPLFILPTILPGILYLYCWWRERSHLDRSLATSYSKRKLPSTPRAPSPFVLPSKRVRLA